MLLLHHPLIYPQHLPSSCCINIKIKINIIYYDNDIPMYMLLSAVLELIESSVAPSTRPCTMHIRTAVSSSKVRGPRQPTHPHSVGPTHTWSQAEASLPREGDLAVAPGEGGARVPRIGVDTQGANRCRHARPIASHATLRVSLCHRCCHPTWFCCGTAAVTILLSSSSSSSTCRRIMLVLTTTA